jgi:acetyltransferase-like isoleucine patch superfamily enzyme
MSESQAERSFGAIWGALKIEKPSFEVFAPDAMDLQLREIPFSQCGEFCDIRGRFDDSCRLFVPASDFERNGKIIVVNPFEKLVCVNVTIVALKIDRATALNIFDGFSKTIIGRTGYAFTAHFYIWPDSIACIGDQVTSNGVRVILGQSDLIVGRDTMISDEVLLQTIDQHGIVDVDSMEIINLGRRRTIIGQHVWVGRRSTIMRDVSVGNGSIVAAGAMVTSNVDPMSVVAGIPARPLRQGTSWSRNPTRISQDEAAFFRKHRENP